MARNWNELGIAWEALDVEQRVGPNNSNMVVIGQTESPSVTDLDKAIEHFGKPRVLVWLNHSGSFPVRARSVYKGAYKRDASAAKKMTQEEKREAVYSAVLMSAGGGGRRVVREIRLALPGYNATFTAGSEIDYTRVYSDALAAAIDQGIPDAIARGFIANALEQAGITPNGEEEEE
jgi:hypothetical protein